MNLLATRDTWWMRQCDAALLAVGIPARWMPGDAGATLLDIPTSEAGRAAELLSELYGEDLARRREIPAPVSRTPLILQPPFAAAVGMAILTLFFFWITGPTGAGGEWIRRGAYVIDRVLEGDWWRLITAATLHADAAHAVGNAGFFLVLGWAGAERFGAGVSTLVWLLTAVLGFVATMLFSEVTVSVGASGGLFGLLGAAGGHAFRYRHNSPLVRRERMRALGGAVLLLAFTAFSPRANIHAHVGGFVTGLFVGAALPRSPAGWPVQSSTAVLVSLLIGVAWAIA